MTVTTNIDNLHSIDDIISVLQKLFYNFDNVSDTYYNMYLNNVEMDVSFKRYNTAGVLETLTVPNVAKMRKTTYTSKGTPEGQVEAGVGYLCIDVDSGILYYKSSGTGVNGWTELWGKGNLVAQDSTSSVSNQYLPPDGDASELTNLNLDNVGAGTLSVTYGGTGSNGLTGIIKGNGTNAYTAAVDGIDFIGPLSSTGMICYYPVVFSNSKLKIPTGWLICDGSSYSTSDYSKLFNIIGYTYGGSGTSFNVPNLLNYFIRCINSTVQGTCRAATNAQESQNKSHTHGVGTLATASNNAAHSHSATCSTTGNHCHGSMGEDSEYSPFGLYDASHTHVGSNGGVDFDNTIWNTSTNGEHSHTITVNSANATHSHSITGTTSSEGGTEGRVLNLPLVPIIKY